MCGFSGFATTGDVRDLASALAGHRLIRHRGPDDEGFVVSSAGRALVSRGDDSAGTLSDSPHIGEVGSAQVFLGHRRLSIIDLTSGGHQPMADETGRYQLVYNGEVFNYLELREELKRLGHTFRTACDTEVVLHALIEWGAQAFPRFNGMWALAMWDTHSDTLVLSRDRFGIKPLFLAASDDAIFFGSEVKVLRALLGKGDMNAGAALRYLDACLLNDRDETFWTDVREVPPAHWAEWTEGRLKLQRYWDIEVT